MCRYTGQVHPRLGHQRGQLHKLDQTALFAQQRDRCRHRGSAMCLSRHEQDRLNEAVRNLCKVRMVSTRGGWYKVPADDATSCLNNNELQLGAMLYPEITTIIEGMKSWYPNQLY